MEPKLQFSKPAVPVEEKTGATTQSLYLPVRVLYEDETGEIVQEIARTTYISANKATIPLRGRLQLNMVVRAALPLPPSWRKHSFTDQIYVVPAEVVAVQKENDFYVTNLKFLSDRDAMRRRKEYEALKRTIETKIDAKPKNRRNDTRLEVPVELTLQVLDDFGNIVASETTVTENISKGGARLMTSQEVRNGDIVHVKAVREAFEAKAVVKNAYMNSDRVRRINIQFIDAEWKI